MAEPAELINSYRRAKQALEHHARRCATCRGSFDCTEWDRLNDEQHNATVALNQANIEVPD